MPTLLAPSRTHVPKRGDLWPLLKGQRTQWQRLTCPAARQLKDEWLCQEEKSLHKSLTALKQSLGLVIVLQRSSKS